MLLSSRISLVVAMIGGACTLQPQSPPSRATTPSIQDRGAILSRVIMARWSAGGGASAPFDGCTIRHLLDDRADYSSLLEKQSRFLVLDLPEAVCGPQPNYNDRTRRVVIKSITYNEGGATVEATFVLQEASHWERYTLRSNALGGKIFWGVSEILFYGFATI